MLEKLFGNRTVEQVLLFIYAYGEGYAQEIADTFDISLSAVQRQLERLETGGVLVNQLKGRTRVFTWNPRWPFLDELNALLKKALVYLPEFEQEKYFRRRTRPRRTGKPL
jgi:DNA-binding transcriptional ArsR family regulator